MSDFRTAHDKDNINKAPEDLTENLRDVFEEKENIEKGNIEKQNYVLYLLEEERRKMIFFCVCDWMFLADRVFCLEVKSINSSNTGAYPRFHEPYFHTQHDASSKTSSHI